MFKRSAECDDTLPYVTYFMFDRLHSPVSNCHLFPEGGELSDVLQYVSEYRQPPQVIQSPPGTLAAVLKATRPSRTRRSKIEFDEKAGKITHSGSFSCSSGICQSLYFAF